MVSAELIDGEDLKQYSEYWLRLFKKGDRGRPDEYYAVLRRYVRVFHFDALAKMLEKRGAMKFSGEDAEKESKEDDDCIQAYNPSWVAPLNQPWVETMASVDAENMEHMPQDRTH